MGVMRNLHSRFYPEKVTMFIYSLTEFRVHVMIFILSCVALTACNSGFREFAENIPEQALCSNELYRQNTALCRRAQYDPTKVCRTISGGGTTTKFDMKNCFACTVQMPENAIDNNFATSATVNLPPGPSALDAPVFSAISQIGIVYPAGNRAAAVLELGSFRDARLELVTFLSGAIQEDAASNSSIFVEGGLTTVSFKTSKPFDAVGLRAIAVKADGQESLPVVEFCNDTTVP
jgi:hypothetical protein